MRKKTQEEFEKEIEKLGNNEYKVLGIYDKNNKPVKIKHLKCGCYWSLY